MFEIITRYELSNDIIKQNKLCIKIPQAKDC